MSIPGLGRLLFIFLTFSLFVDSILHAQNIKINEICSSNYISYEDSYDEKGDWVEFYNPGSSSINMAGMYLTDDFSNLTKFRIPTGSSSSTTISADNHRVFWFDDETYKGSNHANFKLSSNGDRLALVATDGATIIDSVTFSKLTYDVTYGRTTDGSSSWSYFPIPTPDDENSGGGYAGITDKASFNMDAGFYSSSIQVTLSTPEPSSTIYYSLNGNEPSPSKGILYTGPVTISSTRAMRARVYRSNYIPGEVTTHSFFINKVHDLPVLSVVTDSSHLWDENTGIYCFGVDDYDHFYPYYGANFWKSWKRPAHIELFEASGAEVVSQNLKLSLSGNTSRVYAQKSFNFEAEDALGKKSIPYQLFPQIPVYEYKAFKVRNGGSDWSSTGIRDAFNHTILEGAMDVDHQSNRPVVLYLNGDYWGVISMTEKIDEDYLNGHFPSIDKDSVDLLFSNAEVANGNANDYNALISFIGSNSLSQQSNYNYVKSQMDIQEYMNYFQSRIYFASTDWPNKNIYYWRPQDKSMKWRWIMWDTDRSDLLSTSPNHPCNVNHNTLAWATTSGSVASWAQFLLNNLLLNAEFRSQFITQYAHHMNFTFCPIRTDSVLNVFRSRLHNELPAHINRWKNSNDTIDYFTQGYYQSRTEWNKEVDTMKIFFDNRAGYMRSFIKSQFGISGTSEITLAKVPSNGGYLKIDTFFVPSNACDLKYFDGYPVTITALAAPGYVFAGWTASGGSTSPLQWNPKNDTTVIAYFNLDIAPEPVIPSTNYSAIVSNCTDIQLNWTSGDGTSRIVVAKADSAVNLFPIDHQVYTASSFFGNGTNLGGDNYVVYSGNASGCSITGLTQGVTYHFAIFEINGNGTMSNYNTLVYLVGNTSISNFAVTTTASSNNVCSGSSSVLSAIGGVSYLWSPISGLSSTTSATVTATPVSSTQYTVTATNMDGCTSTDIVALDVSPLPSVSLDDQANACDSSSAFQLNGGAPLGGVYSGTAVTAGSFDPTIAGTGFHWIFYSYTDSIGCIGMDSSEIFIAPLPNIYLGNDTTICAYHNLVLDAGSGLNSYLWSTGDTSQFVTVDSTGNGLGMVIYSVTGTNNFGCSTDASIKVTYDICAGINDGTGLPSILVFPNPFSEEIMVVSDEDNLTFSLYNILGEVIFRKSIHAKSFNLKPNVTPGIYFLFIETSYGSQTVKLVKTHSTY